MASPIEMMEYFVNIANFPANKRTNEFIQNAERGGGGERERPGSILNSMKCQRD